MAINEKQQITELVNRSNNILIVFKKNFNRDAISASLALADFLRKQNKKVEIVCSDFISPSNLGFLPTSWIKDNINDLENITLTVDLLKNNLKYSEHKINNEKLEIILNSKIVTDIEKNFFSVNTSFKYDLIFLINSPDLNSLGGIYDRSPDFFYVTPKINIDHSHKNEYYGNINLVDLTATSSSEIVYNLINFYNQETINEDIATYLLTGIISATKNFKNPEVTPVTLRLASKLIELGARREKIVQSLYQNRFLSTLKLWGRVLSRLNSDLDGKLVWSSLSLNDFVETASDPKELKEVMDEMITTLPKVELAVLFFESIRDQIIDTKVMIYGFRNHDIGSLAKKFVLEGDKDFVIFTLSAISLVEAQRTVLEEIKKQLIIS